MSTPHFPNLPELPTESANADVLAVLEAHSRILDAHGETLKALIKALQGLTAEVRRNHAEVRRNHAETTEKLDSILSRLS